MSDSLYSRLGGYDAIVAFTTALLGRLRSDDKLGRFWQNRGKDGIAREHQLLIDYLVQVTGGHMVYTGRDMHTSHEGMGIDDEDWGDYMVWRKPGALERDDPELLAHIEAALADELR